jgi:hypothetical protein
MQQTLAALARLLDQTMNDIQVLDAECQERVLKAAMEAEASIEQQTAQRLKSAVEEAERNTRARLTEEIEERLKEQMVSEHADREQAERTRFNEEAERLRRAVRDSEGEQERLKAECKRANDMLRQTIEEHSQAQALTEEAAAIALERQIAKAVDRARADAANKWTAERAGLIAQRDRAFQSLAELDSDHQQERARLRGELEQATSEKSSVEASASKGDESSVKREVIYSEITRVEELIQSSSRVIEDPSTELSLVIRKNAERAELESYLRGLRFILAK